MEGWRARLEGWRVRGVSGGMEGEGVSGGVG